MNFVRGFVGALLPFALLAGCGGGGEEAGSGSMQLATIADFCAKCADCVAEPGFSEGFCTPFISNLMFDRLACASKGDTTQLDNQNLTVADLQHMSCADFDHAE
jgi:hypothetical protein